MKRLRISLVSVQESPVPDFSGTAAGGRAGRLADLAVALARRGHQVTIHTRIDRPGLNQIVTLAPGVLVHHIPAGPPHPLSEHLLLRALVDLPGAELLLAGGPPPERLPHAPEARRLRALAADLEVGDRFHLLGRVPPVALPALLRSADLVTCPARHDPYGTVPLAAMACGIPVVAATAAGPSDAVADSRTGRLVPPDHPEELARACRQLLAQPSLRVAYGAAGRRRVLDHFAWDRVATTTELVYRQLLTGRARRTPPLRLPGSLPVRQL